MKRALISLILVGAIGGGGYYYFKRSGANAATDAAVAGGNGQNGRGRGGPGGPGGGFPGGGFPGGGGPRMPMTVEVTAVKRGDMTESLAVVGNLIGAATVEAVPKVSGRLEAVYVRLGDRVTRGQRLAKVEDMEIEQQVKQAKASFDVSGATIRQREADLKLAKTNLDRSQSLFERQLIPKQTFDDTYARY